jgi:hypothetical protein
MPFIHYFIRVNPEGNYVAVRTRSNDMFICTERAANSTHSLPLFYMFKILFFFFLAAMGYQTLLKEERKFEVLLRVTGPPMILVSILVLLHTKYLAVFYLFCVWVLVTTIRLNLHF